MQAQNSKLQEMRFLSLSELHETGEAGIICAKIRSIDGPHTSKAKNWTYRRIHIHDFSMSAVLLIAEEKFNKWKILPRDCIICEAKSAGLDFQNHLNLYFNKNIGEFDASRILFDTIQTLNRIRRSYSENKPESLYQLGAREAASFAILVQLYLKERVPQHYNKWAQIHQISSTSLFYMGLVERVGTMTGLYYPSEKGLRFYFGEIKWPKRKKLIRSGEGVIEEIPPGTPEVTLEELLEQHENRDSVMAAYKDVLSEQNQRKSTEQEE